jgi:hypothetical protein
MPTLEISFALPTGEINLALDDVDPGQRVETVVTLVNFVLRSLELSPEVLVYTYES